VSDGAATLTYHPVSMLTAKSNGTKYSLRAASAAACVATLDPSKFFSFNNDLLTRQPAVDSDGFSDKELADIAQANGSDDPKRCAMHRDRVVLVVGEGRHRTGDQRHPRHDGLTSPERRWSS
jgi:hypothetical protein